MLPGSELVYDLLQTSAEYLFLGLLSEEPASKVSISTTGAIHVRPSAMMQHTIRDLHSVCCSLNDL